MSYIYLEIPNYEEVLHQLDQLKAEFLNASHILEQLYDLRHEENQEIAAAKEFLSSMRERLKTIDEELYVL